MPHLDKVDWALHLEATFEIYRLVHRLYSDKKLSHRVAGILLGNMLGASTNSWKVVGITPKALVAFRKQNFLRRPVAQPRVERGHFHHRRDVVKCILGIDFLDGAALAGFWERHDETVLCLTDENAHVGSLRYFPINGYYKADRPYFANARTSFEFDPKHEGKYLEELVRQVDRQSLKLTTRAEGLHM